MESGEELIIYRRSMRIPYRWAAGLTAARFYREIAQEKKIFGTRCPSCRRVLIPARQNCSRCFAQIDEWVEVARTGTVESFTITHYQVPHLNVAPPIIYALIKLDGADTSFIHRLSGVEHAQVKMGMRVEAVFAAQPSGNILDIDYFKPVE
jgi:uncharacterized OB-fold protein